MDLNQLKQPTKANMAAIGKAGLTVEEIATMTPYVLMRAIKTNRTKSDAIIKEAGQLVNAELLRESEIIEQFVPPVDVQKSVRVRRIEASQL